MNIWTILLLWMEVVSIDCYTTGLLSKTTTREKINGSVTFVNETSITDKEISNINKSNTIQTANFSDKLQRTKHKSTVSAVTDNKLHHGRRKKTWQNHNDSGKVIKLLSAHGTNGSDEWHLICRIPTQKVQTSRRKSFSWKTLANVVNIFLGMWKQPRTRDNVSRSDPINAYKRYNCSFAKSFKISRYFEEYSNSTIANSDANVFPFDKWGRTCSEITYRLVDYSEESSRLVHNIIGVCRPAFIKALRSSYYCYNETKYSLVSIFQFTSNDTLSTINRTDNSDVVCDKGRESFQAKIVLAVGFLFFPELCLRLLILMSILSLVIALALYSSFEQLRNIPGLCNMFLSGNLILIYVTMFISTFDIQNPIICSILGLADHFFRLSSVLWVNACLIHMFRVFILFKPNSGVYFRRSCVFFYFAYVHSLAVTFVILNITATRQYNALKLDSVISGYNSDECEILEEGMQLRTLYIPGGVILAINVCLILLIWLRTWWRPIIQSNNSSNRRMVLFYSIVTAILGLHVVFYNVYSATYNTGIGHMFVLLNSTYGMGFLIVFLTTPQVRWLKIFWRLTHKRQNYEQNITVLTKSASFP